MRRRKFSFIIQHTCTLSTTWVRRGRGKDLLLSQRHRLTTEMQSGYIIFFFWPMWRLSPHVRSSQVCAWEFTYGPEGSQFKSGAWKGKAKVQICINKLTISFIIVMMRCVWSIYSISEIKLIHSDTYSGSRYKFYEDSRHMHAKGNENQSRKSRRIWRESFTSKDHYFWFRQNHQKHGRHFYDPWIVNWVQSISLISLVYLTLAITQYT